MSSNGPYPLSLHDALPILVANEQEPDIVQISGGEPTIHPDFFAVLDAARRRPIRHLMVNTNGVRIARDAELAKRLDRKSTRLNSSHLVISYAVFCLKDNKR